MVCFPNNKFVLVSTSELALPVYVKDILEAAGMEYKEVTDLEDVIGDLDVLYMTRIQKRSKQLARKQNRWRDMPLLIWR